jgi:phosphoglycerate dehydrogenase-like enzyme
MRALQDGTLGGAGLDVTDPEPLPADHPLWACPNLIVSPHVAGAESPASFRRLAELTAENARRLLAGEPLLARLDLPPA